MMGQAVGPVQVKLGNQWYAEMIHVVPMDVGMLRVFDILHKGEWLLWLWLLRDKLFHLTLWSKLNVKLQVSTLFSFGDQNTEHGCFRLCHWRQVDTGPGRDQTGHRVGNALTKEQRRYCVTRKELLGRFHTTVLSLSFRFSVCSQN